MKYLKKSIIYISLIVLITGCGKEEITEEEKKLDNVEVITEKILRCEVSRKDEEETLDFIYDNEEKEIKRVRTQLITTIDPDVQNINKAKESTEKIMCSNNENCTVTAKDNKIYLDMTTSIDEFSETNITKTTPKDEIEKLLNEKAKTKYKCEMVK